MYVRQPNSEYNLLSHGNDGAAYNMAHNLIFILWVSSTVLLSVVSLVHLVLHCQPLVGVATSPKGTDARLTFRTVSLTVSHHPDKYFGHPLVCPPSLPVSDLHLLYLPSLSGIRASTIHTPLY